MMSRFVLAIAGVLLCLAAAPAGGAQPADPVVATAGDVELRASHARGELCLKITEGASGESEACSDPPRSHFRPLQLRSPGGGGLALALPPDVAVVSLEAAGGTRRFDTVAAPGFAARFLLVPAAGRVRLERFYAADGRLVGAATDEDDEAEVRGGHVVLRARRATVRASRGIALEPDPVTLDRTVGKTCLIARVSRRSASFCLADDDPQPALEVDQASACAPARDVLYGLAAASIRRVEVQLGSGRRVRSATRALPGAFGARRGVAVPIPRGEAVRFVRGLGPGGRETARRVLAQAPGGLPCTDRDSGSAGSFGFYERPGGPRPGPSAAVATVAGHRLLVADAGEDLCAGIDRIRRHFCGRPPVEPEGVLLTRRGTVVGGVLSGDVASADLDLDRGPTLRVPSSDGPGYTGRFAGKLRYLLAAVPAGRRVVRVVLRDASGERIGRTFVFVPQRDRRVRRLGRTGLVLRRVDGGAEGHTRAVFCVGPARSGLRAVFGGDACTGDDFGFLAAAAVGCHPRRALVYGRLPRGVRGVGLVLAGGGTLRARVIRLPGREGGGRVWTLVPPRYAKVRAVRFLGRLPNYEPGAEHPKNLQPFRVAPATRQCGYLTQLLPH